VIVTPKSSGVSLHTFPPAEQVYRSFVPLRYNGFPIEEYFSSRFGYLTESEWVNHIQAGRITVNGKTVEPGHILHGQDQTVTRMGFRTEPPANRTLEVIYEDRHVRIFNKAAPIPVHPCGRYFQNSMTELLKEVYPGEVPRPVQRLDAKTTGVIVFARSKEAASFLMREFQENRVSKEYLALVEGKPDRGTFVVDSAIGKILGSKRGVGEEVLNPKPAVTEVEWLASIGDRSLLRVVPRSGRTNQIRVHLAETGLPIINDPVYGRGERSQADFGLHASGLRFRCLDREVEIHATAPNHFEPFLDAVKS
jgi:23S rRNA pseudouridine1911/1915/1917 synthase